MKPDWSDSPPWAKWLAQDGSGEWWWYEKEPRIDSGGTDLWVAEGGGEQRLAQLAGEDWEDTKEPRP